MSEDPRLVSGKRFAEDLRRLREARGLSIDDLHRETKIPHNLIRSFEATSLFNHPMFNRVYLRSFVRTYAELVRAPQEQVLKALETALEGHYTGGLAARVLEDESSDGETTRDQTHETPPPPWPAGERTPDRPPEKSSRWKKESRRQGAEKEERSGKGGASEQAADEPPAPLEEPAGEAWSAQSPPAGASGEADAARRRRKNRSRVPGPSAVPSDASLLRVGAGLAAVALVAAALVAFWPSGEDRSPAGAGASADTAAAGPAAGTAAAASTPPRAEIGATLDLVIVGALGPVQGIRLTRDGDLRRPYWIEEGAATAFPAEERILVEEDAQIAKARLLLEGYPFPHNRRDAQGRIRIDRSAAQAFLDTVRGAPVQLPAAPDTNRIPVPR